MKKLKSKSLSIFFHKSIRHLLPYPPSIGIFELNHVADYEKCPDTWKRDGFFIGINEEEALFFHFDTLNEMAIIINKDDKNALTNEKSNLVLKEGNHLISPPKKILDFWFEFDKAGHQFIPPAKIEIITFETKIRPLDIFEIYLIDKNQFKEITDQDLPPIAKATQEYITTLMNGTNS